MSDSIDDGVVTLGIVVTLVLWQFLDILQLLRLKNSFDSQVVTCFNYYVVLHGSKSVTIVFVQSNQLFKFFHKAWAAVVQTVVHYMQYRRRNQMIPNITFQFNIAPCTQSFCWYDLMRQL